MQIIVDYLTLCTKYSILADKMQYKYILLRRALKRPEDPFYVDFPAFEVYK